MREIRRAGFIAGIEVARRNGDAFDSRDQIGAQICLAARRHGLLTRPIRDVIVLMLPLCVTFEEIDLAVDAIAKAITEVCARPASENENLKPQIHRYFSESLRLTVEKLRPSRMRRR